MLARSGTKIQALAWDHASEAVKQQIDQLSGFTCSMLACYVTNLHQRLSLADMIVVEHACGVSFSAKFVGDVDPWVFLDDQTKASIGVKKYVQSTLDKARASNGSFHDFTKESKTSYLLSPFLLKPKMRPELVRMPRAKAAAAPVQTTTQVVLGVLPASLLTPREVGEGTVPHAFSKHLPETPAPPSPRRCARGVPPGECCSARLHTRGPRSRQSCAHLPTTHRPSCGPFGNALADPSFSVFPGPAIRNRRGRPCPRTHNPGRSTHPRHRHLVGNDREDRGAERVPR